MILVTGATGLVGANLMWYLLKENAKIIAIKRETSNIDVLRTVFSFYTDQPEDYLSKIEWRNANVLDIESLNNAMKDISIVYHCAAIVSLGKSADNMDDTNVVGTRNIVEVSLKSEIEKLCFVSSIAACGQSKDQSEIDENSLWVDSQNRSAYSRSKYYAEQEVWHGISKGLKAVIVNPGVILGVSGSNSSSSQLFYQVKNGMLFYTMGGSGYVDVQDVVIAMIMLMKSNVNAERYILVSENCSNRDILWWMADGFEKNRAIVKINRPILYAIAIVVEVVAKIFKVNALIDRKMALTATKREYYNSNKIKKAFNFEFKSIQASVVEICKFMK